jgi:dienelactone hydrolase family protein
VGIEDCLDLVDDIRCPIVLHFAELDRLNPLATVERIHRGFAGSKNVKINMYAGVHHAFASPERPTCNEPAATMAYSRSLALFRKVLGPEYDLSALWDKHLEDGFASRDLEANMKTMVAQPYVNDIPTLTGGVGYDELYNFYKHHFDFVDTHIKSDVQLSSISGGTDIISCFVLGNACLPVWRGEIQCAALGLAVEVWNDDRKPVRGVKGELVCTRPFPSMPLGFWNDPTGERYRSAYFERFCGVWCHGDFCEITEKASRAAGSPRRRSSSSARGTGSESRIERAGERLQRTASRLL